MLCSKSCSSSKSISVWTSILSAAAILGSAFYLSAAEEAGGEGTLQSISQSVSQFGPQSGLRSSPAIYESPVVSEQASTYEKKATDENPVTYKNYVTQADPADAETAASKLEALKPGRFNNHIT